MRKGQVTLVGAGPGDPDLLTIKGHKALSRADVVVYDRLVNKALLDIVSHACIKIYAGKRKHLHALSQTQINEVLVEHANKGLDVVRLKGGDSFIFGRGGEEAEALNSAGIAWDVVPGITTGIAASASSGIPLTHRDHAQAVTFMTAHRRHGRFELDWALASRPNQTVVFYMASSVAQELVEGLCEHGVPSDHLFSIVSHATRESEIVATTTLEKFLLAPQYISAPAVLILHDTPVIPKRDVLWALGRDYVAEHAL